MRQKLSFYLLEHFYCRITIVLFVFSELTLYESDTGLKFKYKNNFWKTYFSNSLILLIKNGSNMFFLRVISTSALCVATGVLSDNVLSCCSSVFGSILANGTISS